MSKITICKINDNRKPYKHVKRFRTQMNLEIHFFYMYFWINNLINIYKIQRPLKFEKSISFEHQFGEIRLHAWWHKIKVG